MHISNLRASRFKCFTDLTIDLPGKPRLIVLCGENGRGKSSILDAIASWRLRSRWGIPDPGFFAKGGDAGSPAGVASEVQIVFHEDVEIDPRQAVYVRTAQRLTVEFGGGGIQRLEHPHDAQGPHRSIDLDDRVGENYQRLISASIDALWDAEGRDRSVGDIVDALVGRVDGPLGRLLPGLKFDGPDQPLHGTSTFRFSKGESERYAYKHLSGGEKAVFDLLLDATLKGVDFADAVWCIDEPELHVNPRIHGALLAELMGLLGPDAQLWIASHSAGMLAEARRLYAASPGEVVFLDLTTADPDEVLSLGPIEPDRAFWRAQMGVALGDLAALIAPSTVVLCEGSSAGRDTPRASWDARVLEVIFGDEYPDTAFVSVGNADDVIGDRMEVGSAIEALISGTQVLRVVDRDARSPAEIADLEASGCRVLARRHLEAYLLDDEVLDALCDRFERPDLKEQTRQEMSEALDRSVGRGNPRDDYKKASGEFVAKVRQLLGIRAGGNTAAAFLRDTMSPLVGPGMAVYDQLRADVFGTVSSDASQDTVEAVSASSL